MLMKCWVHFPKWLDQPAVASPSLNVRAPLMWTKIEVGLTRIIAWDLLRSGKLAKLEYFLER